MKKFLSKLFKVVGGIVVVIIVVALVIGIVRWIAKPGVADNTILEVNFECGLIEYIPDEPVAKAMLGGKSRVHDIVSALEKASEDDRVVGLIAHIGVGNMGLAEIQEIRDALKNFRGHGKTAIAYAETIGEWGPANGAYYLSTAFDKIYLQPVGEVCLTGLISENPFIRGTLEKMGIVPRMGQRYEYKNAANMITEKKFTEAHREAVWKYTESRFNQIVNGIAEGRQLSEDSIRLLCDEGPYLADEAIEAGLVDELAYRDEVYDGIKEQFGEDAEFLYLSKYLQRAGYPHSDGEVVALIYGVGTIARGESGYNPIFGSLTMGSESVAKAFRAAIDDDDVKAILFRVNSPGGSAVASDVVWRETIRAKEAGKPVIVSMGNVAGSGGYFVSMGADKIIAQPATITGSIGVLSGKMLTSGFWEKLGISWDEVHTSKNATIYTGTQDYTKDQWQRFNASLDFIYEDFTGKVAEGRGLPLEEVLKVAKGRVWTFPVAIRLVKEAIGVPEDEDIDLRLFPEEKSTLDMLLGDEPENSEESATVAVMSRVLQTVQPLVRMAREVGLISKNDVLALPADIEP